MNSFVALLGFVSCHLAFEALNEALVNLEDVPKGLPTPLLTVLGPESRPKHGGFN